MTHTEHDLESLCATGADLYEQALRKGYITTPDAVDAPCLIDSGLVHPVLDDPGRLEPVAPVVALNRLLRGTQKRIAEERRREHQLVEQFAPLLHADSLLPAAGTPSLQLLSGTRRINQAIDEAMAEARHEVLCIQPHTGIVGERGKVAHTTAYRRDQEFLDRGGRNRAIYQASLRHVPTVYTYVEVLKGDTVGRSLDRVTDRLIVIDRKVAFIPANGAGTVALEVRQEAVVKFFVTTFEVLWDVATPMFPKLERRPTVNGITPRQQAIAALLVEGHTDAVIADRLGMNIRTARDHIAKLAATLGSESRAQLGYLIGRSGILAQEGREG
ncbi:helix-turn-helix transcriptional regulator [Streptomyces sp. NPDC101234]|uniref:helix-turn-helix transcriptional regulator n=1 Tax=Streptomyces sp. NPDC101234 TaxID=3366138 RepID=UPI00381D149B